ncbi:ABC transporter permease [Azorhizobium oxalatiphilum]|uniref:ABC transporter permease n=1 Tax=Azorhizobium oxalatiphilum TaxID=980631 RepID=A0A917F7H2_9HYPH|nr:ATP-binding cassette domain-containing protein [Azorhizobium oxalatiphilum]GGF54560.1 ABC transporter permease [Azorhizobium oxalatiphilum]
MIEIRNVAKSYGKVRVVDDVTLTIARGGLTSLVGPNGAGKSTLLSIAARLIPADTGTVSVDGLDVARTPSDQLARRLAILRQDNHVTARLNVRDLVAFGRYPHSKGRPTAEDRTHVERALAYMDLDGLADRFLDELSGGQRQRAFIAMTLCQETDYLLLDEPLNNLDIRHGVELMKLLRRAATELGKTVVLVLHDVNFASSYSDRIIAMRSGRVVLAGTPDEVMTPDNLSDVFGCRFDVHTIAGKRIATYFS